MWPAAGRFLDANRNAQQGAAALARPLPARRSPRRVSPSAVSSAWVAGGPVNAWAKQPMLPLKLLEERKEFFDKDDAVLMDDVIAEGFITQLECSIIEDLQTEAHVGAGNTSQAQRHPACPPVPSPQGGLAREGAPYSNNRVLPNSSNFVYAMEVIGPEGGNSLDAGRDCTEEMGYDPWTLVQRRPRPNDGRAFAGPSAVPHPRKDTGVDLLNGPGCGPRGLEMAMRPPGNNRFNLLANQAEGPLTQMGSMEVEGDSGGTNIADQGPPAAAQKENYTPAPGDSAEVWEEGGQPPGLSLDHQEIGEDGPDQGVKRGRKPRGRANLFAKAARLESVKRQNATIFKGWSGGAVNSKTRRGGGFFHGGDTSPLVPNV
ncbi:hypothetical protein KSP40_PGU001375 [Platanthera guangdongensis]|uniref:Uncharacterized protein n=1 Tax=Platanthera guangdongensis TaxID=2320717 RepID=A0ABR2LZY0_9ASPA